jgi:cathepsin D
MVVVTSCVCSSISPVDHDRNPTCSKYKNPPTLLTTRPLCCSLCRLTPGHSSPTTFLVIMFHKATLLTIVTLIIHATAVPVKPAAGIAIPLHKRKSPTTPDGRRSLATPDGSFDHAKAIRASAVTRNRHKQNHKLQANGFAKRGGEQLTNINHGLAWSATLSIGTPPVNFSVELDSTYPRYACGSSTVLTHASQLDLPTCGCPLPSAWSLPVKTITSTTRPGPLLPNSKMELLSSIAGPVFTETVTVADIQVTDQFFSPVTDMSDSFTGDPNDGVSSFIGRCLRMLTRLVDSRIGIHWEL